MKSTWLFIVVLGAVSSTWALERLEQVDNPVYSQLGETYRKTEGKCYSYIEVFHPQTVLGGFFTPGYVAFNRRHIVRGRGAFSADLTFEINRNAFDDFKVQIPPPSKKRVAHKTYGRYRADEDKLSVRIVRAGRKYNYGSGGFPGGSYSTVPKENHKIDFVFRNKNGGNLFTEVDVEMSNKTGLGLGKTRKCRYRLIN